MFGLKQNMTNQPLAISETQLQAQAIHKNIIHSAIQRHAVVTANFNSEYQHSELLYRLLLIKNNYYRI